MDENMAYHCFRIDKGDPDIRALADRYKHLRLAALQQSPSSFSSTLEIEEAFTDYAWTSRLCAPGKETFICCCVAAEKAAPLQDLWLGQVTLLGPISAGAFCLSADSTPEQGGDEERWQMLSLYTLPSHRGKGLGKMLCRAAFHHLSSLQGPSRVRVRIMVKPENQVTLGLYRGLGFVDAGRCTLEEALKANGDADLLPRGTLPEKYTTRSGIVMTVNLDRLEPS
ncbi:acetyltransferase (GNAT) family protein [Hirsutella rhossiliensis]|uniref:Acetyltransferase (GNAT) family domain-containing protein n=1 Tax=Hirsutella rhossiliensis TaxID=111463 RepID=A0A9P8SK93_9HYPO|nr:acetyltransferase (GNAT) family domain-containing protein [Hirsutella rhossiliensis]KAH0966108.1 acetyltransferase (GNAT) family domain-containing protein [Hirsutella rhossiliensis]